MIETFSDVDIVARTLFGEARGEVAKVGLVARSRGECDLESLARSAIVFWTNPKRGLFKTLSVFVLE